MSEGFKESGNQQSSVLRNLWRGAPLVLLLGVALGGWFLSSGLSHRLEPSSPESDAEGTLLPSPSMSPLTDLPANLLEALDGSGQVVLPQGWKEEPDLNPVAQIQAANREQQMYLVVRAQAKDDLGDLTFDEFATRARQQLIDRLAQVEETGPSETVTQVGEFPAVQYKIQGTASGIGVVYLHTTVDTPEHYTQILTWTSPADFARNEADMQALIQTVELR